MTVGVLDPPSGKVRELQLTRAQVALPIAQSARCARSAAASSATCAFSSFSEGSARPCSRKAVEKVEREGAEGIVLDLRENGGGLLEEAVLARQPLPARRTKWWCRPNRAPRATPSTRRSAATCRAMPARRPDRPQHRLRGGDPHRGARRRRRRHGGRHPLLRQGRLPAGVRPLQRRRAEADGRRILHPERGQPGRLARHPPGRPGQRQPAAPSRDEATRARPGGARRASEPGYEPRGAAGGAAPKPARDAVEALLRERLGRAAASAPRSRKEARGGGRLGSRGALGLPRRDLTELPTFTVDPATARDFDDAVSAAARGRRRARLDPHRRRRRPRARPARRSTSRRGAAPTAPTSRGRSSRCCPTR